MSPTDVSIFLAFSAGLLSFVSPCVLSIIPSYISYMTGLSLEELSASGSGNRSRQITILNSLAFILGFSLIFILLGASATYLGRLFFHYQGRIRQIGGILIILFGLYLIGLIRPFFLSRDLRFHFKSKPAGYLGSFLVGIAFAAGWTPCVGPILGSILLFAGSSGSIGTGISLLTAYSAGLALPLFLMSLGIATTLTLLRRASRHLWIVSQVSGVVLVAIGLLLFTNSLTLITTLLTEYGIGWSVGQ